MWAGMTEPILSRGDNDSDIAAETKAMTATMQLLNLEPWIVEGTVSRTLDLNEQENNEAWAATI